MRESLNQPLVGICSSCGSDVPQDKIFCPNCLFNVNGVKISVGISVPTPHVSRKVKDPWNDHVGYHNYCSQLLEDQGKMTKKRLHYAKARQKLLEKEQAQREKHG